MTIVKGLNAIEKLNETKESTKNALKYLKAGDSMVVSVPSTEEVAQVFVHNVFGVFNSCLCTKEDLFDEAVDYLYSLANGEEDEDKKKELKDTAYQLKAKPRFLFGFHDLETGEPVLIDASKKQGQSLFNIMMLTTVLISITMASTSFMRIYQILTEEPTIKNPSEPVYEVNDGSIIFKNVSFKYHKDAERYALKDVDII